MGLYRSLSSPISRSIAAIWSTSCCRFMVHTPTGKLTHPCSGVALAADTAATSVSFAAISALSAAACSRDSRRISVAFSRKVFATIAVFRHGTPPLMQAGARATTLGKEAGVVSQPSAPHEPLLTMEIMLRGGRGACLVNSLRSRSGRVAVVLRACHIKSMEQRHPHADATYRVIRRADGTFGVEVTIPETQPTTVTSFATTADAETWIAAHKQRATGSVSLSRRLWRKAR